MSYLGKVKKSAVCLLFLTILCTCSREDVDSFSKQAMKDPIDWDADLTKEDIKTALRPPRKKADVKKEEIDSPIPPLSDVVLTPDAPDLPQSSKKISLTVTETIPLRDVLLELARQADVEIALDPSITGGIILSVQNRPMNEVLDMVADLAELKYTVENGVLKIMRDTAYMVHYEVDYLNITRTVSDSINTSTGASSGGSGGSSGGSSSSSSSSSGGSGGDTVTTNSLNSGSTNTISNSSTGDLWASVENNITSILNAGNKSVSGPGATGGANAAANAQRVGDGSTYSFNKQAGVISVYTTFRKHKSIKSYLDKVLSSTSAQVLIEAKVLEIQLNDEYASGVDWKKFSGANFNGLMSYPISLDKMTGVNSPFSSAVSAHASTLNIVKPGSGKLSAVVDFLRGFGLTRALSNPRVTVMNNQQAVLTFARNEPYFTIKVNAATTTTGTSTTTQPATFETTLNTLPIGLILALQPSINLETQEVSMHIRPTLTASIAPGVNDPSIALNFTGTGTPPTSTIPIIQVRELDTILKAKSGEIMVIGGLIQHKDINSQVGLPFLQDIPLFGKMLSKNEKQTEVVETIILIQATIVPPRSNYSPHDKKVYETFTRDPNPFVF